MRILIFGNFMVRGAQCTCIAVQSNHLFSSSSKAGRSVPWCSDNLVIEESSWEYLWHKRSSKEETDVLLSRRRKITTMLPHLNHREQITLNYLGRTVRFTASHRHAKWVQMRRKVCALKENPNSPRQTLANRKPSKAFPDDNIIQLDYKNKDIKHVSHILTTNPDLTENMLPGFQKYQHIF